MLTDKIKAVNRLYGNLDRHLSAFKRRSCIQCRSGCGECCLKSELNATVLEFLPAAYNLYMKGEYEQVLERINGMTDPLCVFFNPFSANGNCSMYRERGLIFRVFGYSGRINRNEVKEFITCSIIKEDLKILNPGPVLELAPNMSSYYMRLFGIDPDLSIKYLPINQAIKKAIELVAFDSGYRRKPA